MSLPASRRAPTLVPLAACCAVALALAACSTGEPAAPEPPSSSVQGTRPAGPAPETATRAPDVTSGGYGPVLRINAGGPPVFADPAWGRDTAAQPSELVEAPAPDLVGGTWGRVDVGHPSLPAGTPAELFQTLRLSPEGGDMAWSATLTPGHYVLRLYFAETWEANFRRGARTFDIAVSGRTVHAGYDVYAAAGGGNRAVMEAFDVEVGTAPLTVTLTAEAERAALAALEIVPRAGAAHTAEKRDPHRGRTGVPPGPETTGPRLPTAQLAAHDGSLVIREEGAVVSGLDINGGLVIDADDVTVRDFRLRDSGWYPIRITSGRSGILIEHCEVDGLQSPTNNGGLAGGGVTVRHCNFHGHTDSAKMGSNSVWEHNWLHGNGAWGTDAHVDGLQSQGLRNVVIRGNRIDMPIDEDGNSAIILLTTHGPIDDVLIEGNWLDGGNYTVYVRERDHGPPTNVIIRGNRFGRGHRYGTLNTTGPVLVERNLWDDTGEPLR